jgi:uncharacterized delta-60 repeat protein
MEVLSDGKILIGGSFSRYNNFRIDFVARLNADGTRDPSFCPGTSADPNLPVYAVASQPDGKIIIGGGFNWVGNVARNHIARLNADGSLDTSFDPGTGANSSVRKVIVLPDGKILVAGWFFTLNEIPRGGIARLNSDGAVDLGFDPAKGANMIETATLQPDGKILVVGGFTTFADIPRGRIARLHPDGSLDMSFDPGTGANGLIYAVAVQPDGTLLVGGDFTSFNGVARTRIARLHSDGELDLLFAPDKGANGIVRAVASQSTDKVLVGGSFTTINDVSCGGVARLFGGAAVLVSGPAIEQNDFVAHFRGAPGTNYTVEYRDSLCSGKWQKLVNGKGSTNGSALGAGVFELRDPLSSGGQRTYRIVHPAY